MEMREKIKALRKQLGVNQEGLADLVHVAQSTVSRWETRGSIPEPDHLVRLAALAGKTLDEFMADIEEDEADAAPHQSDPVADGAEPSDIPTMSAAITVADILSIVAEDDGGLYARVSRDVMAELNRFGITDEQIIRKGVALTYHKVAKNRS